VGSLPRTDEGGLRARAGLGAGAVRIPLGNLLPADLQVQIWLTWLEAEGVLDERGPSGTLVSRAGGRSRAVLLFRDLRPEDFLLLHPDRSDYEFVEETAPPPPEPTAAPVSGEPEGEAPPADRAETRVGDSGEPARGEEAAAPPGWDAPLAAFLKPVKAEG
jgi:hypothetical protein